MMTVLKVRDRVKDKYSWKKGKVIKLLDSKRLLYEVEVQLDTDKKSCFKRVTALYFRSELILLVKKLKLPL